VGSVGGGVETIFVVVSTIDSGACSLISVWDVDRRSEIGCSGKGVGSI
jgi:hypothetical protein